MNTLNHHIIRLRANILSFDAPIDEIRRRWVQFWRCNDLRFQIGIFNGDEFADISNFKALYLSVRALEDGHPPSGGEPSLMLGSTKNFNHNIAIEHWKAGTQQHAEISFPAAENALESGEYWLSIWATTHGGQTLTLTSGACTILENGGVSLTPPKPQSNYYTAVQCDQKFAPIESVMVGDGGSNPALGNAIRAQYYTKAEVDQQLADYYPQDAVDVKLNRYEPKSEIDARFSHYDPRNIIDAKLSEFYLKTETYTRSEIDTQLRRCTETVDEKLNHLRPDDYIKTEINTQLQSYVKSCDDRLDEILAHYYTRTETDAQLQSCITSHDEKLQETLADYCTKSEANALQQNTNDLCNEAINRLLENYHTRLEVDQVLGQATAALDQKCAAHDAQQATDLAHQHDAVMDEIHQYRANFYTRSEIDATFSRYYTVAQCDAKFAQIRSEFGCDDLYPEIRHNDLHPEAHQDDRVSHDNDPGNTHSETGDLRSNHHNSEDISWSGDLVLKSDVAHGPWSLRQATTITTAVPEVVFEHVFNADAFWHYKLCFSFAQTSIAGERLLMVLGYDDGSTTIWETHETEYDYHTIDFVGNTAKYATYSFCNGFFGLGHDNATYRYNGSFIHGEMDLWNDGNRTHPIQACAQMSSYRNTGTTWVPIRGTANLIYKNVGAKAIRSMKLYVANGTLTSGRFMFYGIH
jgi:hypothetical protein